jgi:hypothetical protein
MNFFMLMYLTFIRGPAMAQQKKEEEEKAFLAKEAEDRKNGVVAPPKTCKKCDATIDEKLTQKIDRKNPMCHKCQVIEDAERQAELAMMQKDMMMTPFLWFQMFVMLVGIVVFVHRNVFPLF